MTQLEWKTIDEGYDRREYITQDIHFSYVLRKRDRNFSVGHIGYARTKCLTLLIRELRKPKYEVSPMPDVLLSVCVERGASIEDVLRNEPFLGNQIWDEKELPIILSKVEEWLNDYGYLKTLKKFKEE